MAFTDPQTVTIDATPIELNRIKSDGFRSEYLSADEGLKMVISHQEVKGRTRRMIRLDQRVIASDPLTSVSEYKSLGVYLVIDEPEYGFSDSVIDTVVQGLKAYLSSANVIKICTNQH